LRTLAEATPRNRLPVDECLTIGLALTAAVQHLHEHGLVHRDIKPSNIIFVGGVPKLADIGLVASMDQTMSFVGTAGYLPPEGPGTPQADLYSLGKVLYEISTGRDRTDFPKLPPELLQGGSRREEAQASISQLSTPNTQPISQSLLTSATSLLELNTVILKACHHDPRQRYQSAQEMAADLALLQRGQSVKRKCAAERRFDFAKKLALMLSALGLLVAGSQVLFRKVIWRTTGSQALPAPVVAASAQIKSVVVLPFDNESPDKADEHLGIQMAGELTSALARVPELRVLGQHTSAALKAAKDLHATAQTLGLFAILTGNVRKSGSGLRLTAHLMNPADDALLWSEVYDGDTKDIFGMETEIVERIAEPLRMGLTGVEPQPTQRRVSILFAARDRRGLVSRRVVSQ
jgi:TolB-like protein